MRYLGALLLGDLALLEADPHALVVEHAAVTVGVFGRDSVAVMDLAFVVDPPIQLALRRRRLLQRRSKARRSAPLQAEPVEVSVLKLCKPRGSDNAYIYQNFDRRKPPAGHFCNGGSQSRLDFERRTVTVPIGADGGQMFREFLVFL